MAVALGGLLPLGILYSKRSSSWKRLLSETVGEWSLEIDGVPVTEIPSACRLRAFVTGSHGRVTFDQEFSGGRRLAVASGRRSSRLEAGPGLLELCTDGVRIINGPDIEKQYYQVHEGRPVLIRLEGKDGRLIANDYGAPNKTIGPAPRAKTPEEWEVLLGSKNEGEVLEALVWIGGRHLEPGYAC
jgi:hypothetical protein